ncbi:MAG TPA: hypothetical protein VF487_15710 [Chitinophagaceae bacterium]
MDSSDKEALIQLVKEMGVTVREDISSMQRQALIDAINRLLEKGFQKLVAILYRLDVSETKLKNLLSENPNADAAVIIAELMIERQVQKIKSRQHSDSYRNRQRDNDMDENEKW